MWAVALHIIRLGRRKGERARVGDRETEISRGRKEGERRESQE